MPAIVSSTKKQSQKTFFSTRLLYSLYSFSIVKSQQHRLTLRLLPKEFAVCRLAADTPLPQWASRGAVFSITRTADELSIVCEGKYVPSSVKSESGWRCFKLEGPFPFAMTGVLASVLGPLAEAGVSIFSTSTYDTDYVMVKKHTLTRTIRALQAHGHVVNTHPS
jgi:uncharacterized protein